MKRTLLFSSFVVIAIVHILVFAAPPATITINPNIPGTQDVSQVGPCGWVVNFYNFALLLSGILAFGAIVFGGFLYATSAGNPSRQSEGRSWIQSALLGLLLLAGAYMILYLINPGLTSCSLPTLAPVNFPAAAPGQAIAGVTETQSEAASRLRADNINVVSTGNCSDKTNKSCTSLDGIRQDTVDEVVGLKDECGCTVTISGGTETGHDVAANGIDHQDGYKVDLQLNSGLTNYIQTSGQFTRIADRTPGDGAPQWQDKSTGAVYALEASKNHWDVTVP